MRSESPRAEHAGGPRIRPYPSRHLNLEDSMRQTPQRFWSAHLHLSDGRYVLVTFPLQRASNTLDKLGACNEKREDLREERSAVHPH